MIYKNRSMHGTKSETDIYVENDTGAICLWQYSDKTWSPKPSKDLAATTAQQIALGIGGGK